MKSMVVLFALCAIACGSLVAPPHLPLVTRYAPSVVVAPSYGYNTPLLVNSGLGYAGHGHYLYKRSLGHYTAPSAVSHQSRVDVISSPAVVSHAVVAPVVAAAPAAISHQSRVDVHTSPAVFAHTAVAPIAHAAVVPVGHHGVLANINHAAVAPIGYATPYNHGRGYYNSAPLVQAW